VAIFAVYFQLFVIAKTQVENGVVSPAVGIWWVPALLAVLILALLRRSTKVDGSAKSPLSALRCISKSLRRT
jgi:lipopolysaccharide export LptBFGC system permease protein LptF